jgi:septum site-determining protein MinC
MYIERPAGSRQQIYARGRDLVTMAAVNAGAEVIADGHIHVYAPLRGRAIAGAKGNTAARIFALCTAPALISIAGAYCTGEGTLTQSALGKSAQFSLQTAAEDSRLVVDLIAG